MKQHSMISQSIKPLKALLALSALLITSPSFAQNSTDNHIHNAKSATYDYATGQGLITLESYVDGEVVDEHFSDPMNFVMVLDVSNSMCPFNVGDSNKKETVNARVPLFGGDQIAYLHQGTEATHDVSTAANYTANHDWKTTITIDGKTTLRYTIKLNGDNTVYNLAYFVNGKKYGGTSSSNTWNGTTGWYYGTSTTLTQSGSGSSARWKQYTANSANDIIYTDVKLDLLENACRNLIDLIYANPPTSGSHKISIVTYAQEKTPVLNVPLTALTASTVGTLKGNVTHMTTAGNTYAKVGLDYAITNLNNSSGDKYILFLTDGEPNNKYADILGSAKTLKDGGAKIFSIALVGDDTMNASRWNSESTTTIKAYLEAVSSLYPNAVSMSNKGTPNNDGQPYYQWSTGVDLVDTFKKVGQSFSGGAGIEDLDPAHEVYLKDKINMENCVLVKTDGTDIKTYIAVCTGKDSSDSLTFDTPIEVDSLTVVVNATTSSQSIDVEGFDYSGNWCGYDAEHETYHGMKLIVTIPFKMKAPGDGTFDLAKTNLAGSSLYKGDNTVDGAAFPIPEIPFTELTIQKYGLKAGDSAVYIIKKGDVEITRVILTGTDDEMVSIKLRILEPGFTYSVTETWWDYTYTLTDKDVTDNVFKFYSSKKSGMEYESEHRKVNDFK